MKKNLLYLSLTTISLLFTACGETIEKDTTASTKNSLSVNETPTNASDSTPTEEIKESTQSNTSTETKETPTRTDNLQEQNSSSTVERTHFTEEVMKLETTYNIKKGETIIPISDTPKIEIITNTKTGATTATLLLGEAKILKKS